ncbi:hypothetical protein [Promicromonospora panici]|nr:hypothetical protein [Promicromonospora panici]
MSRMIAAAAGLRTTTPKSIAKPPQTSICTGMKMSSTRASSGSDSESAG